MHDVAYMWKMADARLCFQCDVNPRDQDDFLCKSCKLEHKLCYECGEKERNHPYNLCTGCYQAQRGGPLPVLAPSPQKQCILDRLNNDQQTYKDILKHFKEEWVKLTPKCPAPPVPLAIFAIQNKELIKSFHDYSDRIKQSEKKSSNSALFYHGTKLTCNLLETNECCLDTNCGICGISSNGFDSRRIGSNIPRFQRFGRGIYLAPNSSKCHDYTQGIPLYGLRAQLLCLVACGAKYELLQDNTALTAPPDEHHSVYGKAGGSLNYDEIVVFDADAVMPQFIVVYKLDGVEKIAK